MFMPKQLRPVMRPIRVNGAGTPWMPAFFEQYPPGLIFENRSIKIVEAGGIYYSLNAILTVLGIDTPAFPNPGVLTTTITMNATGGTFTITAKDSAASATTRPLAFNVSAADLHTALVQDLGAVASAKTIAVSAQQATSGNVRLYNLDVIDKYVVKHGLDLSLNTSCLSGGSASMPAPAFAPMKLKVTAVAPALALKMAATSGSFTLTVYLNGAAAATNPLPYNISAGDLELALQQLPLPGATAFTVAPYQIEGTKTYLYVVSVATGAAVVVPQMSGASTGSSGQKPIIVPQSPGKSSLSESISDSPAVTVQLTPGSCGEITVLFPAPNAVSQVDFVDPGRYSVAPGNPVSVIGGDGQGAQFFLFYNINHPNLLTALQLALQTQDPDFPVPDDVIWSVLAGSQQYPNDPQRFTPVSCYRACSLYSGFSMRRCFSGCRR